MLPHDQSVGATQDHADGPPVGYHSTFIVKQVFRTHITSILLQWGGVSIGHPDLEHAILYLQADSFIFRDTSTPKALAGTAVTYINGASDCQQ